MLRIVQLALLVLVFSPTAVHAQYTVPGFEGTVRMTMSPVHPRPGDIVTLSLESALIDLARSTVSWEVDGRPRTGDDTRLSFVAPALGARASVRALVTTPEGSLIEAALVIAPTELDLLYESDSYTPPFYRGRALPSAGSTLRLQALPRFKKPDGSFVPTSEIIFTWRKNGQVLGSLSGRGRATAVIPSPLLFSTDTILVEAETRDGAYAGSARASVSSADPVLRLYEDHPLYGLRFNRAFGTSTDTTARELTLAAIPFFASVGSPTDAALSYEWTVNGTPVETNEGTRNALTIGGAEGGEARISLNLLHTTNIFFGAEGAWGFVFSRASEATSPFNPF